MSLALRSGTYLWRGLAHAASFCKEMVTSSPVRLESRGTRDGILDQFNRPEYRLGRYRVWWALYENNLYDNVHAAWAPRLKASYGLPRDMRGCYNPGFRLGNFWGTHTWVGKLDPYKQNGRVADSACPILTENEAIRPALERLWRDSQWAINKELTARTGAVLGDVALRVEDDTEAGKVRILPVNPATIAWAKPDYQGNVDAYVIVERRRDPRFDPRTEDPGRQRSVEYQERVARDGDTIYYETYLDGEIYPWNGVSGKYEVRYGFVPLVLFPHMKALPDSCWGWGEFQGAFAKAIETDRVASELHTQIRKSAHPKFFVAGTNPDPRGKLTVPETESTREDPQPEAHELAMVYGGIGSTCVPMLYTLDIQFTSMEIQNQLMNLEKDYPELRYDSARATGDASAKALREVRKACESKVHGRRVVYDDALVRAHKMALAIGGWRGYEGYEAFDLGSYAAGDLDHSIGERTVFLLDPLDRIEEIQAQLTAWQTGKLAQVPDEFLMDMFDFSPEQKKLFQQAKLAEMQLAMDQQLIMLQAQAAAKAATAPPNTTGSSSQ
jgi:hypothetical protein